MRKPDFDQFLKVLHREAPDRPTLYEFYMNDAVYQRLTADAARLAPPMKLIRAFEQAGYDYASVMCDACLFPHKEPAHDASYSMNDTVTITDRATLAAYAWPEVAEVVDFDWYRRVARELPGGMKLIPSGPGGLLENLIMLMGFENLCLALADDPELVRDLTDHIGATLLRFYEGVAGFDTVGACMINDDWGFCAQPMLAPATMRELILPWHRKMVAAVHAAGKPALLHSCGNLTVLMDEIIDDLKFDGKHSFEDKIQPIEAAYEMYQGRIALLGGIDVDFLCRSTPEQVRRRALELLERTARRGGYALGSGNSIPPYVPLENYFAMIGTIHEF